jgi:virginiamycin A acetyltransferase
MYSVTVRDLYRMFHGLEVGLYTIGPCESGPENLAPGTSIGRYCSIYYTVRTLVDDCEYGCRHSRTAHDGTMSRQAHGARDPRLIIGNDVFIGHNAIILPTVERIGDGAFVGAGAVVQKTVPPYAVVLGNPARVVKYRFSEKTISQLLESRWWNKSLDELESEWETFEVPLERSQSAGVQA